MKTVMSIVGGLVLASSASAAFVPGAALFNPPIAGNTQYDGWISMTTANYPGNPGHPGTSAFPAIGSNRTLSNTFNSTEAGDALLSKTSNGSGGGAYIGSGALHFGGISATPNTFDGTIGVSDATPVANLANIVFQIQISQSFGGFDFFNSVLPVLNYNGGTQNLAATTNFVVTTDATTLMGQPSVITTYALQWDLSSIPSITSFSVDFGAVQHVDIYGVRLDQSDSYNLIPVPGAAAMLGMGGLLAARRRR